MTGRLVEQLAARGVVANTIVLDATRRRPGSWRAKLEQDLANGAAGVYVLGGDGTVLAAATALIGRDVPLGIVPLGTANLLARDIGMPLVPEDAIRALDGAQTQRIDVGRVNGEPFLCASMLGLGTTLSRTREAARGLGWLRLWTRLLRKTLWLLVRDPYRWVELDLDGRSSKFCTLAVTVTNNPLTRSPGLHLRRARLDSGRLGVYGVHRGPFWAQLRLALRVVQGDWPDDPQVFDGEAQRVGIRGRRPGRITVMNDGERRRVSLPLVYDILPSALPVFVPVGGDT